MSIEAVLALLLADLEVRALIALVALDVVSGIASAMRRGEFSVAALPAFLLNDVLPYLFVWGAVKGIALLAPPVPVQLGDFAVSIPILQALSELAFLAGTAALIRSILTNFAELRLTVPSSQ